jgi:hypothetical protein
VDFPPSDIIAYNRQRSCSDLVRIYQKKQLVINPDFQRDVVHSMSEQKTHNNYIFTTIVHQLNTGVVKLTNLIPNSG